MLHKESADDGFHSNRLWLPGRHSQASLLLFRAAHHQHPLHHRLTEMMFLVEGRMRKSFLFAAASSFPPRVLDAF